jgi:hypothetical protein
MVERGVERGKGLEIGGREERERKRHDEKNEGWGSMRDRGTERGVVEGA